MHPLHYPVSHFRPGPTSKPETLSCHVRQLLVHVGGLKLQVRIISKTAFLNEVTMGIWFDRRALGSNANADARISGAMRRNRDEEDNRSFHLRKLLWGSPKSEHRRVFPLPGRSLARSAAQKLPTLLNHHFLKPQLPFSVRRRCAETERRRRRRPGGEMVWVKKPPHRKRRFVCRMKKSALVSSRRRSEGIL